MTDGTERTRSPLETVAWGLGALLLMALAVPWFLWGNSTVVAGLPLWIWWHVGWMALASAGFYAFARYGWGVGVEARAETAEVGRDG